VGWGCVRACEHTCSKVRRWRTGANCAWRCFASYSARFRSNTVAVAGTSTLAIAAPPLVVIATFIVSFAGRAHTHTPTHTNFFLKKCVRIVGDTESCKLGKSECLEECAARSICGSIVYFFRWWWWWCWEVGMWVCVRVCVTNGRVVCLLQRTHRVDGCWKVWMVVGPPHNFLPLHPQRGKEEEGGSLHFFAARAFSMLARTSWAALSEGSEKRCMKSTAVCISSTACCRSPS